MKSSAALKKKKKLYYSVLMSQTSTQNIARVLMMSRTTISTMLSAAAEFPNPKTLWFFIVFYKSDPISFYIHIL